jgi:hypothetical protein
MTRSRFKPLYQLYLDLELVAHELRERRPKGWRPLKQHVEELYRISRWLWLLDRNPKLTMRELEKASKED